MKTCLAWHKLTSLGEGKRGAQKVLSYGAHATLKFQYTQRAQGFILSDIRQARQVRTEAREGKMKTDLACFPKTSPLLQATGSLPLLLN